MSFYAPPVPRIVSPRLNPPRTYDPLLRPPQVATEKLPSLPHGRRSQSSLPPALSATHVLTSHIVTAAWPRMPSELFVEAEHEALPGETKNERIQRAKSEFAKLSSSKRRAERRETSGVPKREEVLYSVFNRYRRKGPWHKDGLTLLLTHAAGFPKEIWEPTLALMISQTEATNSSVKINEVWAYEMPTHGDSAMINAGNLGILSAWSEITRDLLHFLLYYLPEDPATEAKEPPLHLPRLPERVAEERRRNGFAGKRTIVAVGHSAGATAMVMAGLWEPKMFHSLVLLDPVIMIIEVNDVPVFDSWVIGALTRRSKWSSRDELRSLYANSSRGASCWHPSVLETFLRYGITDDPNGPPGSVKLKGPVYLEASCFSERQNGPHTYEALINLNPEIEVRFIYSGTDSVATGGEVSTAHVAWRRSWNTSNVRIPASHLMVQEAPSEVSKVVVEFLQQKYSHQSARL